MMRKGIHIGPNVARMMVGLCAVATIVVIAKEMPAMRRYLKSESM